MSADLEKVKKGLERAGFKISDSGISRIAKNKIEVGEEEKQKILNFLTNLEDMDDVQKVYSNIAI